MPTMKELCTSIEREQRYRKKIDEYAEKLDECRDQLLLNIKPVFELYAKLFEPLRKELYANSSIYKNLYATEIGPHRIQTSNVGCGSKIISIWVEDDYVMVVGEIWWCDSEETSTCCIPLKYLVDGGMDLMNSEYQALTSKMETTKQHYHDELNAEQRREEYATYLKLRDKFETPPTVQ